MGFAVGGAAVAPRDAEVPSATLWIGSKEIGGVTCRSGNPYCCLSRRVRTIGVFYSASMYVRWLHLPCQNKD